MIFSTNYADVLKLVDQIEPHKYGHTRNYVDGAITKLSPYISRGLISVKTIFDSLLQKNISPNEVVKFVQQLAWREYFQHVWQHKNIDEDIKSNQENFIDNYFSEAIYQASTGIHAIDLAIQEFYKTGYLHNHLRLYIASLACNVAQSHWKMPAQWMYYYLLDADWASNSCSWQWVGGSFSSKKYYANQENINHYTKTWQQHTFLDKSYEEIREMNVPQHLTSKIDLKLKTNLPTKSDLVVDKSKKTVIYNFYNLDPLWHKAEDVNRILLLEPSHFEKYPVCDKSLKFAIDLSKNIPLLNIFVGEFSEIISQVDAKTICYKEHPAFAHYQGIKENRDWIFKDIQGYYPSFFKFWQQCEKVLKDY